MSLLADLDDFSLSCDDESDSGCDLPLHFAAFGGGGGFGSLPGMLSPGHPGVAAFLPGVAAAAPPPLHGGGGGGGRRRRRAADGDADGERKSRGNYSCSKCGQPKRGHGACAAARAAALRNARRARGARGRFCTRGGAGAAAAALAAARACEVQALTCPPCFPPVPWPSRCLRRRSVRLRRAAAAQRQG
jgi:hypothetical protein